MNKKIVWNKTTYQKMYYIINPAYKIKEDKR